MARYAMGNEGPLLRGRKGRDVVKIQGVMPPFLLMIVWRDA